MLVLFYFSVAGIESSVSAIMGLVAVILYVIYFLVTLIGYLAIGGNGDNDPETDPKIKKLLGWKKLQEEGMITPEEFEEKRLEILNIKQKVNDKK